MKFLDIHFFWGKLFLLMLMTSLINYQAIAQHLTPTIVTGTGPGNIKGLTNVNDTLFYYANFPSRGNEPGTTVPGIGISPLNGGIAFALEIYPANSGSENIGGTFFTEFNVIGTKYAYFFATNQIAKGGLFRNAKTGTTNLIYNINASGAESNAKYLVNVGGTLFFSAQSTTGNEELWKSDGTALGTVIAVDINASGSSFPQNLTGVNISGTPHLFFSAIDSGINRELWYRNVTTGTTTKVEINPGANGSSPLQLVDWNNFCYFFADDGSGYALWQSNGASTTKITLPSGTTIDNSIKPIVTNNLLFFVASDAINGKELWKFDGTSANLVSDIETGVGNSTPKNLTKVGTYLYFTATTVATGEELYRTDGTMTTLVQDISVGASSSSPTGLANVNGRLYFFAKNQVSPTRYDLFYNIPSNNSTVRFHTFTGGNGAINVEQITEISDDFYFVANESGIDRIWWSKVNACPTLTLAYTNPACVGSGNLSPTVTFNPSGTYTLCASGNCFTSTDPNLVINANTGVINLNTTPAGTYPITYTYTNGACVAVSNTFNITVNPAASTSVSVETTTGNGTQSNTNGTLSASSFNFGTLSSPAGSIPDDANISIAFSPDATKMYVADEFNHCIRQVDLSTNTVSTLAGGGSPALSGYVNAIGTTARFNRPSGIAVDAFGIIYVADKLNHVIRRIDPTTKQVTLVAGIPNSSGDVDNGSILLAKFFQPSDIAIANDGSLYITDKNNHKIKKISPFTGVSTLAGNGTLGLVDGTGTSAQFNRPSGISIDLNGDLYVADMANHVIRKVTTVGVVSTFAGTGSNGDVIGTNATAQFFYPTDVTISFDGKIYVADRSNHRIKLIQGGLVSVYAGDGSSGYADITALNAKFNYPSGIICNFSGEVYVIDKNNQRIRRIREVYSTGNITGGGSVCPNGSGTLTLTNFPGSPLTTNIVRWETSINGGSSWTNVGNASNAQYNFTGITQSSLFRAIVNTGTCGQLPSDTAFVFVNPITPPTVSAKPACGTSPVSNVPVTLVAKGAFDGDFIWYDNTNAVIAGQTNDTLIVNISSNQTYSVAIRKGTCESTKSSVNAQVIYISNPTATDSSRCGTGTLTLKANGAGAGQVYRWYDASNTLVKQSTDNLDNTYLTTSLTSTTTYSVSLFDASVGCESGKIPVQTIVNPVPSNPIASPTVRCNNGIVILRANSTSTGLVFRWYDATNAIVKTSTNNTDSTFTTPSLTATVTYSVTTYNPITKCESAKIPVQAIIGTTPADPIASNKTICNPGSVQLSASGAPNGLVYRWYDASNAIVKTSLDNNDNIFDTPGLTSTTSYFVSVFDLSTGCESNKISVQAIVGSTPTNPLVSANPTSICGSGTTILTATGATAGLVYRWYDASNNIVKTSTNDTDNTFTTPILNASTTYSVTIFTPTTTCESTKVPIAITVNPIPSTPGVNPNPANICANTATTLTASGASVGLIYRWYDASNTLLKTSVDNTDDKFTSNTLNANATFQVSIYNPTTTCESVKTSVLVTVNPIPSTPIPTASSINICGTTTANLSASGANAEEVYRWYDASNTIVKTSANNTDNTFITNALASSTTFQVSIYNPTSTCESAKASISITVNPIPSAPTANPVSICGTTTASLSASGASAGQVYRWYDASNTLLKTSTNDTDNTFTTGALVGNTTFQVSIYNPTTNCESVKTSVNVTFIAVPNTNMTGTFTTCAGTILSYTAANPPVGQTYTYNWLVSGGTITAGQGTNQVTIKWDDLVSGTENVRINIIVNGTSCQATTPLPGGPADMGFVTLNPLPNPTITGSQAVCANTIQNYTTANVAGHTYQWTVTGGTFSGQGTNQISVTWGNAGNGIVSVKEVITATNCEKMTADYTVSIKDAPGLPTAPDRFRCGGAGSITLNASEPTATSYNWYNVATGGTSLANTGSFTTNITSSTSFWVTAVNSNNCEGPRQQVQATIDPANSQVTFNPTLIDADSCVASGDSPSGKILLALTGNNGPYQVVWSKTGDPSFSKNTQNIDNLTKGTYNAVITDAGTCITNAGPFTINETLKQVSEIVVTNDTTIAKGSSITLKAAAKDADKFIWSDQNGNQIGTTAEITVSPQDTTTYTVTIFNDRNCSVTRMVKVNVVRVEIFVPNLFTPNGDNSNDLFQVYGNGIKSVKLKVFNRIGELVYETEAWVDGKIDDTEKITGWDGTYKGKLLENGTYVWSLQGQFINDTELNYNGQKTGTVLLMR